MLQIFKGKNSNTNDDQSSEFSMMRQEMSGVEVVALTGTSAQNEFKARKSKTETTQDIP